MTDSFEYMLLILEIFRHAIVEELAGFGVIIHTCARDEAHLNECLSKWKNKGFQVTGSVCDVSSWTEREKLMQTVYSLFDAKLSILVINLPISFDCFYVILRKTDQV